MFSSTHYNIAAEDADRPTVAQLCQMMNLCYTQHIAKRVITREILRHELRWINCKTKKVAHDVPVDHQWHQFVGAAIDSVLLSGCFSWRMHKRRCIVADVRDVTVVYCNTTHKYKSVVIGNNPRKVRWKAEVVYPPPSQQQVRGMDSSVGTLTADVAIINENAPCYQAYDLSKRQRQLAINWDTRDAANSHHSGYTTVTTDLRTSNGSMKPWFRDASQTGSLTDFDTNFDTLVSNRADAIRRVGENTQKSQKGANLGSGFATQSLLDDEDVHEEHTITDGRNFAEASTLTSSVDQANATDRIQTMIFFTMGVPPQVMGKNINSERLASSNRLSEMAISGFQQTCAEVRARIGDVVGLASRLDYDKDTRESSAQIIFAHCLTPHELAETLPFLTPDSAEAFVQCAHKLPSGSVDVDNVVAMQQVLIHNSNKSGSRSEKRKGVPLTKSEADAAEKRAKASDL
jgi:hypothetical protein